MTVTDEHGVDRLGGHDPEEPRDDRVARIDEQPEPVVLDEVATAGTAGRRKSAGATEDGESHQRRLLWPVDGECQEACHHVAVG